MPGVPGDRLAVRVRVPASSANLGPGFDSIGLALGIWDHYLAGITQQPGVQIVRSSRGLDNPDVPDDERHLVYATMRRTWHELGVPEPEGVRLVCHNTIPQGRGLGSSAAAIVAGVALAQALTVCAAGPQHPGQLLDQPLVPEPIRLNLEATNNISSALEGHPDNASASVYGGMTLSWLDTDTPGLGPAGGSSPGPASGPAPSALPMVHSARITLHPHVEPVVLVPSEQLATVTARAILPDQVPHRLAALNSARVGLLVHAISSRPELLLPATADWLHQEQRRTSFPAAMDLVDRLRSNGAAAVISGAGPSVLVLTTHATRAVLPSLVPPEWEVLSPGVPEMGVSAERVTFGVLSGENIV